MTAQADRLAQQVAARMMAEDQASQGLGMTILAIADGRAQLAMTVTDSMLNGHAICHGGFIFTLADSAFAFACNSDNHRTVAQHAAVTFVRPARRGDRLTATAQRRSSAGRTGIYDVTVTQQDGAVIAEFHGLSRRIDGHIVDAAPSSGDA